VTALPVLLLYHGTKKAYEKLTLGMKQTNPGLQILCWHAQKNGEVLRPAAKGVQKAMEAAQLLAPACESSAQKAVGVASAGPGAKGGAAATVALMSSEGAGERVGIVMDGTVQALEGDRSSTKAPYFGTTVGGVLGGGWKWMPLFGREAKQERSRVARKGCCYCCWCRSAEEPMQSSNYNSSSSSSSSNSSRKTDSSTIAAATVMVVAAAAAAAD
jgi:hypothetical protein